MKKLLKVLLIVVAVVVLVFVFVGLFLPTEYEVRRGVLIQAPIEDVHPYVNDLEKWSAWEPWRDADPTIQITLGDITQGVGANQSWSGDSGKGDLTFTASDPNKGIAYDLTFDDRYESKSVVTYHTESDGSTHVEWIMTGDTGTPVIGGYFAMMMDSMIGPMFQNGLNKLKSALENAADAPDASMQSDTESEAGAESNP